jgi:predicted esterase
MTHQTRHEPETEQPHDQQAALQQLVESAFPPAFPRDADPEKAIQWIAGNIDKGMCRIYAVHLNESLDEEGYKRLLERVRQRIDDPQLLKSLQEILTATAQPDQTSPESLAPLLADIALQSIDEILQQAKALGRESNFLHAQCLRVGNEMIILVDHDPRYEWILPAVKKRLREELANLGYEPAAIEMQSLDLTCGHRLRFLDFELSLVRDRHGQTKARYRLVEQSKRRYAQKDRWRLLGRCRMPRFLQPCVKWVARKRSWQFVARAYGKANSIQVGWRHLPITLLPILMLLFGCLSPAALLCFAAIPVCNWRWIVHRVRAAYDKATSIQAGWRHLPITLLPVLLLLFGWRSPVPWLDVVVIFACNRHWTLGLLRWLRRHKLDMVMGACVLAALIFLYPFLRDIYANRPREVAASSSLPPGFYRGEYHGPSWWTGEPEPVVHYGLYVPPHFQGKKGPFPLIVFLHGYGERTKARIFKAGLPLAIAQRFGTNKPNGHFQFIAFFPIDPTGRWEAGSTEVERVMLALDYVIADHRIDPSRVYLTGLSAGGSGVWNLAQAYPHKWAAVAPVCSFVSPDVEKVRHLPAWIFHGDKDQIAPVDRERYLVQQLKEAGADMRYTEVPNRGHYIWDVAYNPKELYKWLACKKKAG